MISEKQRKILAFPYSGYDVLICDGAVRSGKTSLMTVAFIDWAMREFCGQRLGICGKTVDSAVKNIVAPYLGLAYAQETYTLRWRRTDKVLEVTRGDVTNLFELFGGKDESSFTLIQGRTLAGVLLDEVALMPESFFNQALARCSVDGARLWFNCNPDSPQHWFYTGWVQQPQRHNALYLHFVMEDNPSLSEKTLARYKSQYAGVFYERYILGRWVAAEGLVYGNFDPAVHVTQALPRCCTHPDEASGRYFISIDYGTVNPFSAGLWCLSRGVATRIAEYYYTPRTPAGHERGVRHTDEEHYAALEALCRRTVTRHDGAMEEADYPIEAVVIDPSAASMIECIRRHGRFAVRRADNDVLPGIETTAALLGAGKLRFFAGCRDCIREFGVYRWNEKSGRDEVLKENDHAMDDTRYFCYTILRRELRWDKWGR